MKRLALTVLLAVLAGPSLGAELSPYDIRSPLGAYLYGKNLQPPTPEQQREQLIESYRQAGRRAGGDYHKKLGHLAARLPDRTVEARAASFSKLQLRGDEKKYQKLWAACFVQGWQYAKDPGQFDVIEYPLHRKIVFPPVFFEEEGEQ